MIYFALGSDGDLYNLGNHNDWESAENTATDLLINQVWVFNEKQAKYWASFIDSEIEKTKQSMGGFMFYVYRHTTETSEVIAEFSDKDSAEFFMEYKAFSETHPEVTGYSVRDYRLNTLVELER